MKKSWLHFLLAMVAICFFAVACGKKSRFAKKKGGTDGSTKTAQMCAKSDKGKILSLDGNQCVKTCDVIANSELQAGANKCSCKEGFERDGNKCVDPKAGATASGSGKKSEKKSKDQIACEKEFKKKQGFTWDGKKCVQKKPGSTPAVGGIKSDEKRKKEAEAKLRENKNILQKAEDKASKNDAKELQVSEIEVIVNSSMYKARNSKQSGVSAAANAYKQDRSAFALNGSLAVDYVVKVNGAETLVHDFLDNLSVLKIKKKDDQIPGVTRRYVCNELDCSVIMVIIEGNDKTVLVKIEAGKASNANKGIVPAYGFKDGQKLTIKQFKKRDI